MPSHACDPAEALAEVSSVYRDLDQRPVDRSCIKRTECCHFRLTGKTPLLTLGEALVMAQGVRAAGSKKLVENTDGTCPLLASDGKCRVYSHRPFGCRTHFCSAAGGPYARKEVLDLIRRLEVVDDKLGGQGPRALPDAVGEALKRWTGDQLKALQ